MTSVMRDELRDELVDRVRLADAARRLIAAVATEDDLATVLRDAHDELVHCFGLASIRVRLFDEPLLPDARRSVAEAQRRRLPESVALRAAHDLWAVQQIAVVSFGEDDTTDHDPRFDAMRQFLAAESLSSVMLVPLGVGQECLGVALMMRGTGAGAWSSYEATAAREIGRDLGRVVSNARARMQQQRILVELQAVDRVRDRLIGSVSHELRNPLSSIVGHLDLIHEGLLDPVQVEEVLGLVIRSAERMAVVVDDLLVMARSGAMTPAPDAAPVSLPDVVRESAQLLGPMATERGVRIEIETPTIPVVVEGDHGQLVRAVHNLISNAIKYSPAGSFILARIQVGRSTAELMVRDHGIGISRADQDLLFTEFFRSQQPSVQAQPGTGLGLAIVDRIVRAHHGSIEVQSELDLGTTVRMALPLAV